MTKILISLSLLLMSSATEIYSFPSSQDAFPLKPGDFKRSITLRGKNRLYLLHIPPSYGGKRTVPLVLVFHGGGGNGENAVQMTLMSEKADKEGFIAVYPYGTGRFRERLLTWNAGNCCGYAFENKSDDVGFIRVLLAELETNLKVDPKRIFATGISNGGKMCYVLACELADKIAAIAPVAGSMEYQGCTPAQPVSAIIFHGTDDELIQYNGGKPQRQVDRIERVDNPVSSAVSYWVKHNKCSTRPEREERGAIIKESYTHGDNRTAVVLYTIKGGKHAWPGGTRGRVFGDEPTQEISATDLMWEFFTQHPKP